MRLSDVYAANRWLPLEEEIEFEFWIPQTPETIMLRVETAEEVLAGMSFVGTPIFDRMQVGFWADRFKNMKHRQLAQYCKALELPRPGANPFSIPKDPLVVALIEHYRRY